MTILTTGFTPVEIRTETEADSYIAAEPIGRPRLAVTRTGVRDVIIDPSAMEADQPYGYRLDGAEYVVVRRADGRLDFFQLPTR